VARPLAWAGFALSLAGVGFIAGGHGSGSSLGGDALVLAAQLISAGFTVSQARLLRGRDPIAVTALQLMAAGVAVLPIALATEHHAAGPASPAALLATIGLVLAGTVLPTSLFAFGQSRVSADVAGAFLNLEPLVGAAMGMALFAEPAGPVQVAGGAAITVGIGLSSFQVVRSERRAGLQSQAGAGALAGADVLGSAGDLVGAGAVAGADALGSAGDLVGAGALAVPSAEPAAGCPGLTVAERDAARSLPAPGEAPSIVKRTRFPQPGLVGDARLRRPRFRPSERTARPTSRSRRELASARRKDQRSRRQKLTQLPRAPGRSSAGTARDR
jgi:hypothetical protein